MVPSFRSRPLPAVPLQPIPEASPSVKGTSSTTPPEEHTDSAVPTTSSSTLDPRTPQNQSRNDDNAPNRNTIITIGSITTTLPRYSLIGFTNPDHSQAIEQVDHWSSDNDPPSMAVIAPESGSFSPTTDPAHQAQDPPDYASNTSSTIQEVSRATQSPQRPKFVLHRFHIGGGLTDKVGFGRSSGREPWGTLKLLTRAPLPGSKKRAPRFIAGDTLRGSVDLRLDTPMNVHTIKLLLRGKAQVEEHSTSLPTATDHIFLDKSFYIFSKKASEDPQKNGRCEVSKNKKNYWKLHGSYSFPFTIPFPTSVEWRYPTQGKSSLDSQTKPVLTYETPPSFREKRVTSAVVYELIFEVKHGALRSHSRTMTEIIFTPKKVSPPASEKRQIAYREDALLPWPLADPDGWHALPAVMIRGQYQSRPVEAKCILHLAKPLSFTRGTLIPCFFSLSCHDFAFLEALATPQTINFHLFREIGHLVHTPLKEKGGKRANIRTTKRAHIAKAVWWKPPKMDTPPALTEIFLEGEVHLPKSLLSSCDFPLFMIEYAMELLPFTLASFTSTREFLVNGVSDAQGSEGERYESLVKQVVNITNFHEFGPVPKPFTTPATGELARGIAADDLWTTFSAFGSSLAGSPDLNAELPSLT